MADDIIRALRSQFQIGRDLADDAADLMEQLCYAGDCLYVLLDGNVEWDTADEQSRAESVLARWEKVRYG